MKIKDIDLGKHPILLAPMEDVTDPAFRLMCKGFGADMVYTEFVSSDALIRSVSKTEQKLNISDEERPVAIQIYGKDTDTMVEAARIVEQARPDILDINFGCPVKRVAGKGAGAGMLQNIPKMLEITRAVADAVKIPVTVKTRLGWDAGSKIIVDLAEKELNLTVTLDAKTAYADADFVVIVAPTNVYATNRIDVASSKRTRFAHYMGY